MKHRRFYVVGSAILFLFGGCALEHEAPIGPPLAELDGEIFDLSLGWGEANVCLVSPVKTIAECFRTTEEADARAAEIDQILQILESTDFTLHADHDDSDPHLAANCSGWLHIYQHVGCKGRDLRFRRRRYEHNLTDWNFNDQMSSYNTGPCKVTFWEHVSNEGTKFVAGANGPCKNVPSGWNDKVSSLWIW